MYVTLDVPPDILEEARNYAASEGISLDTLFARTVQLWVQHHPKDVDVGVEKSKFGRMPGVVAYIADDFDEIPEGFEEYV